MSEGMTRWEITAHRILDERIRTTGSGSSHYELEALATLADEGWEPFATDRTDNMWFKRPARSVTAEAMKESLKNEWERGMEAVAASNDSTSRGRSYVAQQEREQADYAREQARSDYWANRNK
jgi:hypothetical protein